MTYVDLRNGGEIEVYRNPNGEGLTLRQKSVRVVLSDFQVEQIARKVGEKRGGIVIIPLSAESKPDTETPLHDNVTEMRRAECLAD